ncbi:MAG: ATP-binding protein [Candidatus Rokubacteria bacterium]|nr:ATP-binding protein [Candidatus Rokubacteria bacterium]
MAAPRPHYRVKVRLYVLLAVLMAVAATASGLLLLYLARPFVGELSSEQAEEATFLLFTGAAIAAALATIGGLVVGMNFAGRIREIVERTEALTPPDVQVSPPPVVRDEIGALETAVGRLTLSMDRFVRDSDILARLPQGVLVLDPGDGLISFNTTAESLLGLPLERYRGAAITGGSGPFPTGPGNEALGRLLRDAAHGDTGVETREVPVAVAGRALLLEITLQRREWREGSTALVLLFRDASEKYRIRDQIRKADQLAFLGGMAARVAHEIRTPLATIRGLLELLEADLPKDDARHAYIRRVLQALDRQDHLVENLLTLSHPEPKVAQAVSIPDLVDDLRGSFPRDPRLTFVIADRAEVPLAWGDPFRLSEVFTNLIQNALQSSPPDGVVEVFVERADADRARVRVRNTGVGIPDDLRERIFHPFFTTKVRGTGLGLAIARQIVEAHHGTLTLESDGKSETAFTVELPSYRAVMAERSSPTTDPVRD